jgi:hypothetical protein
MTEHDAWVAAGMPDRWGLFDMRLRRRWLEAPPACGARMDGPPGGPCLTRDVGGQTYYGRPATADPRSHQYPPCPRPDCRGLIPVAEDAPGGTYRCVCGGCRFDLFRNGDGLMRLELAE